MSLVGLYNIIHWNPGIIRALSPYYVDFFFKKAAKDGWSSLGGVVLCITGAEAMFADLGHFSQLSIQRLYFGQYWSSPPTAVASQTIISTTFSIISQFRALRCFPRVKVIHASSQIHGQIYISEVNWILMVLCIAIAVGFRDKDMIGNTYSTISVLSFALNFSFYISYLVKVVYLFSTRSSGHRGNVCYHLLGVSFIFGSLELLYVTACFGKVHKGC
ncbi:probable potassium transporter 13 [Mangifera indica]|uniref:probable potassium transporter 13 n=1 Tax=Mangifera indica TaxID=29780 RepID=UPI001CF9CD46|nr:probable potassium transporter 13 [Mangifera indica]